MPGDDGPSDDLLEDEGDGGVVDEDVDWGDGGDGGDDWGGDFADDGAQQSTDDTSASDVLGLVSPYVLGCDVLGTEVVGMFDIQAKQREMNTLKQVPVSVALVLLRYGQQAISEATQVAKAKSLPDLKTLDTTYWKLKWHEDELKKATNMGGIYAPGDDLKKWVMQAFIEHNAVEEGSAWIDNAWPRMWSEIKAALAALPSNIRAAASSAVETVTGVPLWAWGVGAAALAGLLGFAAYKVATGPMGRAFGGVAARRYLP